MRCPRCHELERALQVKRGDYNEALASAYHRVNRKFAAYESVELERARNELEEHRHVCASTARHCEPLLADALLDLARQDQVQRRRDLSLKDCQQ